jgi:hypothetical protein
MIVQTVLSSGIAASSMIWAGIRKKKGRAPQHKAHPFAYFFSHGKYLIMIAIIKRIKTPPDATVLPMAQQIIGPISSATPTACITVMETMDASIRLEMKDQNRTTTS